MILWDTLSERERDALVAEKVMEWEYHPVAGSASPHWLPPFASMHRNLPRFTTDITAAWEVIEKMKSLGWQVLMDNENKIDEPGWWVCFEQWEPRQRHASVFMRTAPAAICYAALSALEKAA